MSWKTVVGTLGVLGIGYGLGQESVCDARSVAKKRKKEVRGLKQYIENQEEKIHRLRQQTPELREAFENLSDNRQRLLMVIEDESEFGTGREAWSIKDAANVSGMPNNTVRSYVNDLKNEGWIEETGEKRNRSKLYQLSKSRFKEA